MFGRLLLLFVLVPIIELALLIQIGDMLGLWPTIALVLLTGAIGAMLARNQGARVLGEICSELASSRVPTGSLLDGFLVLVGGILLLTPGLLTDLFGLSLLFPVTRNRLKKTLRERFQGMVDQGRVNVVTLIR